jgi:hypothetical protein
MTTSTNTFHRLSLTQAQLRLPELDDAFGDNGSRQ